MKEDTLISVIVPCYNQGNYLSEALDTVSMQTHTDWECIIVNDGSTDNTQVIAQSYIEKDNRFKYIQQANSGLSAARNTGIAASSGKYILPLDADDKISVNYLEESLRTLLTDEEVKIVYGAGMKFGYVNEKWNLPEFDKEIMLFKNIIHCCGLYKKEDWQRVGGYDTNMKIAFEDWEFWLNILKKGGKVIRNDNITFFYRIRENSMLNKVSFLEKEYIYQYVYTKHASLYNKYFTNPIRVYKEREELRLQYNLLQKKTIYSYYLRLKNKIKRKQVHKKNLLVF